VQHEEISSLVMIGEMLLLVFVVVATGSVAAVVSILNDEI
jgi:hypothetical protein